jgi:hypothetical protein
VYIFTCASPFFLVHHITCAPLPFLVHHSYASYIKALYCIVLLTSIYRKLFIILTWYQNHCSKCFVQFSSFLAFFHHLRYCSATVVRIPMYPLLSKVEYITKRLIAFIGIFATSLRPEHLHHHSKDLTLLDSAAQKSSPSDVGRFATRCLKIRHVVTPRHAPHAPSIFSDTCRPLVMPRQP